jgi:Cof subfamily protein (haloacid dehalogenase superfamily)
MSRSLPSGHDGVEALQPFTPIRLVALDIDGTLATQRDEAIGFRIRYLQSTLKYRYGVGLTLATGRALAGVHSVLDMFGGGTTPPLILYNGAVTFQPSNGKLTRRCAIGDRMAASVIRLCAQRSLPVLSYDFQPYVFGEANTPTEQVIGWAEQRGDDVEFNGLPVRWCDPFDYASTDSATAMLVPTTGRADDAAWLVQQLDSAQAITVTRSSSAYIEIRPAGVDKGVALATLARALGIERHEVAAIGDNDNDVEMLRWAGCGVVVKEASPAAVAAGDYTCRHSAADGVIELLDLIVEAKRYGKGLQ